MKWLNEMAMLSKGHKPDKFESRNSLKLGFTLWGEWPSGLMCCNQNREFPSSNPTICSAGLRDLTSL